MLIKCDPLKKWDNLNVQSIVSFMALETDTFRQIDAAAANLPIASWSQDMLDELGFSLSTNKDFQFCINDEKEAVDQHGNILNPLLWIEGDSIKGGIYTGGYVIIQELKTKHCYLINFN